jgi:hypothetical protein
MGDCDSDEVVPAKFYVLVTAKEGDRKGRQLLETVAGLIKSHLILISPKAGEKVEVGMEIRSDGFEKGLPLVRCILQVKPLRVKCSWGERRRRFSFSWIELSGDCAVFRAKVDKKVVMVKITFN